MDNYHFTQWCKKAVSGIIFPPDQVKVAGELFDHMVDHYEDLLAQGYDENTARDRAIDAMGDPYLIARQLAEIHRPFWGYFLRATRIVLVLLFIITVIPLINFIDETEFYQPQIHIHGYDPYTDTYSDTYISDEIDAITRIMYDEPKQQFKSDGYTLELTKVAWTHVDLTDENKVDPDYLCLQIEFTNLLPWAEEPNIHQWLWAQDSAGTVYTPWCSGISGKHLVGDIYHTSLFTWTLEIWVSDFSSQDADWFDICYNRDGRQFKFRIDLPGGDTQ